MRIAIRRGGNVCVLSVSSVEETGHGLRIFAESQKAPIDVLCEENIKRILLHDLIYTGFIDLTNESCDPFTVKAKYDGPNIYVTM